MIGLRAAAAGLALASATAATAAPRYEAEIRRTSYGVPHIKAKDEASLGYGAGYAYAQDNVCVFADEMLTVNGRRSEMFGPDLVEGPDVDSISISSTNRNSDLYFKLVNSEARVRVGWERQPAEVKALLTGYAAGFNRYLAEAGRDGLPAACRGADWVRPITPLDLIRIARRYEVDFSSMRFIDALAAAQPPGSAEAAPQAASVEPWRPPYRLGSNAVALGKDATANGRGMLLGNPHYPWRGILRLYQQQLTVPGKRDVMGVTLPGLPTIVIGFTSDFAWSHTVNTSTHFTLHALELDPDDPTRYRVGDSWRAMTKERVEIRVRRPDGRVETIGHDFWFTRYGPVIVQPGRFDWSATRAYAIRDANLSNNRMLQTWHAMGGARSLDDFEKAVTDRVGLPWVNTIAADREGRALYLDVTPVPNVSAAKLERCVVAEHRELAAQNLFVLDGRDPGCDWDVDPAAPQEGIIAGDRLPSLRRSDFVQNSNDSAWMTNPARPLTGFSPLVSKANEELQGRTRMGIAQIQARIAGVDGLADKRFTLEQLQQVSFSNRVFFASLVRDELNALCADAATVTIDGASVPLGEACAVLRAWDGTAGAGSVGYPLFGLWWDRMEDNKAIWAAPDRQVEQTAIWAAPFSPADPVNTPRGLRIRDPAVRQFALESLGAAIVELRKRGIDWRKPWGEIQYEEAKGERVPVPGGASGDVYNIMYSVPEPPGRMSVALGSSYVLTVSWDDSGRPVADAVLTYSQSSDPASPHSGDQIPVFSAGEWIRQPFTEAQIRADPAYRTEMISE